MNMNKNVLMMLKRAKQIPKIVTHSSHTSIVHAMHHPLRGMFLHWGLHGCGKSTILRHAASTYLKQGGDVVLLDAHTSSSHEPLWRWVTNRNLYEQLSHPYTRSVTSSEQFGSLPMCMIIDHVDHLMGRSDASSFMIGLAEQSCKFKSFSVILSVTCPVHARRILDWNGGQNIKLVGSPGDGRWNVNEIESLVDQIPMGPKKKAKLIDLALIAQTPGFVIDSTCAGMSLDHPIHRQIAEAHRHEWERGMAMVSLPSSFDVDLDGPRPRY